MKFGPTRNYWNDFVFEGYVNYKAGAIYLAGVPDIPASRPHSAVNQSFDSGGLHNEHVIPCPQDLRGLSETAGKARWLAYVFMYLERSESMSSPTPYPKLWLTIRTLLSRANKAPRSLTVAGL